MAKVFLSYAHEDIGWAKRIYNDLKRYNLDVWFDTVSLAPGQTWEIEIEKALEASDFCLILLSAHSTEKKGYVQKEIKTALEILDMYPEGSVYLIPIRLNKCDPSHRKLKKLQWIDVFPEKNYNKGIKRIVEVINPGCTMLRSTPTVLSEGDASIMVRKFDFYDKYKNFEGKGISHEYSVKLIENDPVVIDNATGLMWGQKGLGKRVAYDYSLEWVSELNNKRFAGFTDWRMPTLEEAMSLLIRKREDGEICVDPMFEELYKKTNFVEIGELYIDSIFDKGVHWIWTSDLSPDNKHAWAVDLTLGYCFYTLGVSAAGSAVFDLLNGVRVVRSI